MNDENTTALITSKEKILKIPPLKILNDPEQSGKLYSKLLLNYYFQIGLLEHCIIEKSF